MDPWELIKKGQYREAIQAYTTQLRQEKSGPNYWNRGIAYLNVGEHERALADFIAANASNRYTSDGYLQSVGVVHWLAGREPEAVTTWLDLVVATERSEIQYTDAAGGVESGCLLWFAAVRLGKEELLKPAQRLLKKKAKNKSSASWPGPIAKFLLGLLEEDQLREKTAGVPILRERELCQAEFYIGVRALQAHDGDAAKRAFRTAAEFHAAKLEHEYYLARHELNRPQAKIEP